MQTKKIPYTFVRNGFYYFSRRVPSDLFSHYRYPRIVCALHTKSAQDARTRANAAAAKLDSYWSQLRLAEAEAFGMHLIKTRTQITGLNVRQIASKTGQEALGPTLKEALEMYIKIKGKGRSEGFRVAAERACGYVFNVAGNKLLSEYLRSDALNLRDWLVARGLCGSSVTRNFSYVKAVVNFALAEYALDIRNPFKGVYHDRTIGVEKRKPVALDDLWKIQAECYRIDDDIRWLVALVSDTGMRLAEAAGLSKKDFVDIDGSVPHVRLMKHPWRGLKTQSSERLVPLVGAALWAAKRIASHETSSDFAFPRYNRSTTTSANSASAALNKWLAVYVDEKQTMHSFRHSMRDRLRAVECPTDIVDQIGGWTTKGVGQGYGIGYPLTILYQWMEKVVVK